MCTDSSTNSDGFPSKEERAKSVAYGILKAYVDRHVEHPLMKSFNASRPWPLMQRMLQEAKLMDYSR